MLPFIFDTSKLVLFVMLVKCIPENTIVKAQRLNILANSRNQSKWHRVDFVDMNQVENFQSLTNQDYLGILNKDGFHSILNNLYISFWSEMLNIELQFYLRFWIVLS
jgi:hypothetical protein